MGLSKKQANDEVRELELLIDGWKHKARSIRTTMTNDRIYEDAKAAHEKQIAFHTAALAKLIDDRERAPQLLDECANAIARLRKDINRIKHRRDIERVLELQRRVNELQEDMADEVDVDDEECASSH